MEYNLSKQTVSTCEIFLDTVNEQLVDADITLPDYCPDIEKILKCSLDVKVYTRHISGGQLTIDGVSLIKILYCDSVRHNLRSYDTTVPFTCSFNLKSTPEQYIIFSDTKCEYMNCRALSPRKMVIHGAFSLSAKVLSKGTREYFGKADEWDLQTKTRELVVSDMCALTQEQFSYTEDIEVSNKSVESLLSYDVSSNIKELKPLHNKLMLSADVTFKALYLCDLDSGETEHISYVFPLSRIIDCDCVTDEVIAVPTLEIMSSDIHTKHDSMSDKTTLMVDLKISFSSLCYAEKTIDVIEDAYSTEYETDIKAESKLAQCNHSCVEFSNISKSTFDFGNIKISKIIDVACESLSLAPVFLEQKLTVCGKVTYSIIACDNEDTPVYIERSAELSISPNIDREYKNATLKNACVQSISFRIVDDNSIELRTEIKGMLSLCDEKTYPCVTAVTCEQERRVSHSDCALVLYFADEGENVWDIAKHYRTKQNLLAEENSLSNTVLSTSCMLLVPTE